MAGWVWRTGCAALLVGALAGCGYHPLYATRGDGTAVTSDLATIGIPEPRTRVEQLIRNDLLSAFQSNGSAAQTYLLSLTPAPRPAVEIKNPKPGMQRNSYTLSVSYQLVRSSGGDVLTSGTSKAFVSYDNFAQPVAKLGSEADAEARAAHDVSEDIRTRIAAYFASRG